MADQIRRRRGNSSGSGSGILDWDTPSGSGGRRRKSRLYILRWGMAFTFLALAFSVILWSLNGQRESLKLAPLDVLQKKALEEDPAAPSSPEKKSEAVTAALLGFVNDRTHQERALRIYQKTGALERLTEYYDHRGNSLPQRVINPAVSALSLKDRELLLVSFTDQDGRQ
jgi:hypothetical protein